MHPCVKCLTPTGGRKDSQCASCATKTQQEWRAANPEKVARYLETKRKNNARRGKRAVHPSERVSRLLREYGLTETQERRMIEVQHSRCAICLCPITGSNKHTDHCHITGRVRGLLCRKCNTGIGMLRDDPMLVQRALTYLQQGGFQGGFPQGYT
jgi:recombination endonuclease VII